MIQSMTGFSQIQLQVDTTVLTWEMRSINHRYLDVSFRLPEPFRHLEGHLRQLVRGKISRGKVEFQLKLLNTQAECSGVEINESLVQQLLQGAKRLSENYQLADDLCLSHVMSLPGVIICQAPIYAQLTSEVEDLFQEGIAQLLMFRQREGLRLVEQLEMRLHQIREEVINAKALASTMLTMAKNRLLSRLEMVKIHVEDSRIDQELALILTRLDVNEELDRLMVHIDETQRILKTEANAGKKLDFLMQELNREANTLSSKSDMATLTQCALRMKVLIEQMREQIQNLE
jgi:uncharacterized protein (TIGR00255 family)